ncbi:hypothetical protein [Nonomuraea jabiensis]|uniref:hypothetical protein n=1 Tax=Nonomuraea jabiensis TaxID=882448 RepID=UPI003D72A55C
MSPWSGDPHPGDPTGTSYRSWIASVFKHPHRTLADRWLPYVPAQICGKAVAAEGRVAAVVHTAGVSAATSTVQKIMQVDLAGTAHVIDAFETVATRGTSLVCVASMAGHYASLSHEDEWALATAPTGDLLSLDVVATVGRTGRPRTSSPNGATRSEPRPRPWRGTGAAPASTRSGRG